MATRRSHPPTLETLARRLIEGERLIEPGMTVLVAISGGPDSMALLHALARLSGGLGAALVAHGVDHGLRAEAAAELELARGLARRLGVPFGVTRVEVEPGGNLQARARLLRREALLKAAQEAGAARIATGHQADDRAETVLMRLLQGSGPRGLGCLPPREGAWIRPLLRARRSDVEAHLLRHRIECAIDPSNANSRFFRVRVRREVLPLLEGLSPSVVGHLNALADELLSLQLPGEMASLGRAQRAQVEGARRAGRGGVWVRVEGGEDRWVVAPSPDVLRYDQEKDQGESDRERSTLAPSGGNLEAPMQAQRAPVGQTGSSKVRS